METFKELKGQCSRQFDSFFAARTGRSVTLEEAHTVFRAFKAEHLPQGQAAIAMAKRSKMR